MPPHSTDAIDWRRPGIQQQGLRRYLSTLSERRGLILMTVIATTLAAIAYLAVADKVYEAEADMLVTPISSDNAVPGAGLISESPDPTRDVETAARLITQRDVAERVVKALKLDDDPQDLVGQIEAAPVAQSNIVSITAKAATPELARKLANGFGEAVVAERTQQLHEALDKLIAGLRPRVAAERAQGIAGVGGPDSLAGQLSRYQTLREGSDPTLRLETTASTPNGPVSPRPKLSIIAGLLSGLVLGIGAAFGLTAVDPRLRREEQLRELYALPILARIPTELRARTSVRGNRRFKIGPRQRKRRALAPGQLSPVTLESYRSLRAMLSAQHPGRKAKSVLVTGGSPAEGKTTTAINLASSFALAGSRVILIEADFRRPTVGQSLGVRAPAGIGKVILGNTRLEDALVSVKPFGDSLRLLLVDKSDSWLAEVLSLPTARALLEEAESLCDYVIIDSPPLTEVIDALPLAQQVDDVVLVVRIGNTQLTQLARLGDLLAQNGITPTGFALVGVGSSEKDTYYLTAQKERLAEQASSGQFETLPEKETRAVPRRAPTAAS
jgi:receptor protein-tyrosine kinase